MTIFKGVTLFYHPELSLGTSSAWLDRISIQLIPSFSIALLTSCAAGLSFKAFH